MFYEDPGLLSESFSSIKFLRLPLEVSLPFSFLLLYSPTFLENLPPLSPIFLTFYEYSSRSFLSSATFLTFLRLQNSHSQSSFLFRQVPSFYEPDFSHTLGLFIFPGLFHPSSVVMPAYFFSLKYFSFISFGPSFLV